MSQEIIEKIKQAIEDYKDQTEWEEIGKVVEVGDGILKNFRAFECAGAGSFNC